MGAPPPSSVLYVYIVRSLLMPLLVPLPLPLLVGCFRGLHNRHRGAAGKSTLMGRLLHDLGYVSAKEAHRNQREASAAGKVQGGERGGGGVAHGSGWAGKGGAAAVEGDAQRVLGVGVGAGPPLLCCAVRSWGGWWAGGRRSTMGGYIGG